MSVRAQSFKRQDGVLDRNHLSDLCSVGEQLIWAVGDYGVILHSQDGGYSWERQASGTTRRLWDVYFLNEQDGWAVGDCTTVRHTTDGGEHWLTVVFNRRATFDCVRFASEQIGWIIGTDNDISGNDDSIWRTMDGGQSWSRLPTTEIREEMYCADFINESTGWVAGYGQESVYFTEDAGQTWTEQNDGSPFPINDIFAIDDTTVCAVGYGGDIFRTTNRGTTWTQQTSGTSSSIYNVEFTDLLNGWAVTNGSLLRTTNGGQTWSQQTPPFGTRYRGIRMLNDSTGIAVGDNGGILRTDNRGEQWRTTGVYAERLYSVYFVNRETGFATDNGGFIWKSANSGRSWTKFHAIGPYPLLDLQFINSDTGYALTPIAEFVQTLDGGQTWTLETTPMSIDVEHLFALDASHFWTVGRSENIYFSSDHHEWTRQHFLGGHLLRDVQFVDANTGWAVGDSIILRTRNGGNLWSSFEPQTDQFTAVSFIDRFDGWVVGKSGVVKRTLDGGQTWFEQESGTTRDLAGIQMLNADSGWVCGAAGTILSTIDGGAHWYSRGNVPTNVNFVELYFTDSGLGWFVAQTGEIYRYLDDGPTAVLSPFPLPPPGLLRVYPNPFNNSTTLSFSLTPQALVTISLFDLLGRQIRELDYVPQAPGVQEINFDATGLSSGSYFVRVNSLDFSAITKIILLK